MSRDDDFVTHLKSLERTTPSVSVDREHILSVGRRRRAGRTAGITTFGVVAVVGLVTTTVAVAPRMHDAAPPRARRRSCRHPDPHQPRRLHMR